jgi:CRISPR-associated protein Cas1
VGFLHDFSDYQTKQSLVYDLQEPFRWLSDISVIEAFESEDLKLSDFYFTGDDYRYRFESDAKRRFIEVPREQFNSGVKYKGRVLKWDTVIQEKMSELARYLSGRVQRLAFTEPFPVLERTDNRGIREAILNLTQAQARRRGIGKSTLHYLRRNAKSEESFQIYTKVRARFNEDIVA